jgi:hypothetical protein
MEFKTIALKRNTKMKGAYIGVIFHTKIMARIIKPRV